MQQPYHLNPMRPNLNIYPLFLLVALFSCVPEAPKESHQLRVHVSSLPENIHPLIGRSALRSEVLGLSQGFLIRENIHTLTHGPGIISSMPETDDNRIYEFELRENVRFPNGMPVSSEDVLFTFKLHQHPDVRNGGLKSNIENLIDIEVIDDRHFRFIYEEPRLQSISFLSMYPILQRSFVDSAGLFEGISYQSLLTDSFDYRGNEALKSLIDKVNSPFLARVENQNGLGPYRIESYDLKELVLQKREDHWTASSTQPYHQAEAEKLIFSVQNDKQSIILDLRNKTVDVSRGINSQMLKEIKHDTSITNYYSIYRVPVFSITFFALNMKPDGVKRKAIFTDKRVRKAFAHMLPVEQMIETISDGNAERIASPVSAMKPEHNSSLKPIPYDLDRARNLLEQAGWVDSDGDGIREKEIDGEMVDLTIGIKYINSSSWGDIARILMEGMRRAGVNPVQEAVEGREFMQTLFNTKDFDLIMLTISNSFGNDFPVSLYDSEAYPSGNNFSGFENREMDSLIALIPTAFDAVERKKILHRFQEIAYEELPYVFLTSGKRGMLVRKEYGDVKTSPAAPNILLNEIHPQNN